ncbi:membrane associated rhomboid family serine protease [Symbiobacterium terraclitae]|uniref:Membrane associated rhomboid family serine protease n=1 Tax=Symbiobacterium terraclitae TaxID=557451 RepID=A0ABS4JM99_9FIRM|nr:membrane associated rhomboid family serine protease [Symbiobacterium terraclitae]
MNYGAYVVLVSYRLRQVGFLTEEFPPELEGRLALVVSRREPWGRLSVVLPARLNLTDPQERAALAGDCAAWVRSGRGEEPWQMILLFPFDRRVADEEAEAVAALEERDPDGSWGLIPWCADLEVGLLDQHRGFPPVGPEVAQILTDVPEEPAPRRAERAEGPVRAAPRRMPQIGDFPATRVILALTVAYYLWTVLMGGGLSRLVSGPDGMALILWGANFSLLTLAEQGQQWRLVSHLFVHGGALHLAFNMWALWQVGRYIEAIYGSARMLFIYFVAGVAGGIASVALRPGLVVSVGASGAILGLMGALIYFATTVRHRRVDWQGLLTPVAINLMFGLVYGRVDNYAHVGGLIGGLLAGFVAGVPGERGGWRRFGVPALGLVVALLVAGVVPLRHISTLLP